MSRFFSTTARAFLSFVWKGTEPHSQYEVTARTQILKNTKLDGVDTVEIAGQPHTSRNDPKVHVSGQIFKNGKRVTSLHVYEDGTVGYSKEIFNESQEE
ncbi:hypothetical protein C2857_005413 [Epichloe festucae Fl1]|uniref:Uncharacterized protein n=1 Tax=Epichloe festucae (strain Fl1) TaxID=877507 RepID=A0A7S9KSR9_EPIFF|nr:hypothetical protein C2857_005413 [Epichloe festucae Fl1]